MSNISIEKTIELLNLLRFDNSIPSKFVDNRKLYQWGRNEIIDNTIGKIKELIAENERLKQTNEEWNQYIPFLYAHGFFHEEVEE